MDDQHGGKAGVFRRVFGQGQKALELDAVVFVGDRFGRDLG